MPSPRAASSGLPWLLLSAGWVVAAAPAGDPDLDLVLERLSRTAQLFHDTALEFTCEETITWSGQGVERGKKRFDYIFAYNDDGELEDYRVRPSKGRRRSAPREESPSAWGVPAYVRSSYLWILTFHESRHARHHYRIVGEETIRGTPSVMVEFEPIPPHEDRMNDWYGIAWVDPEMGQLLRVVARHPDDHAMWVALQAFRDGGPSEREWYPLRTVTTEFTQEKNGLRFPGTVRIRDFLYWGGNRERTVALGESVLEVEQRFREYRFYSVRAADYMRDYIRGTSSSTESPPG